MYKAKHLWSGNYKNLDIEFRDSLNSEKAIKLSSNLIIEGAPEDEVLLCLHEDAKLADFSPLR